MTNILDFSEQKAKDFLLNENSYTNIDLPEYFRFSEILKKVDDILDKHKLQDFYNSSIKPENCENVNYKIIANKDGLYAWRPFQLIHPALYVNLVNIITEYSNWQLICNRFKLFQQNPNIRCVSVPVVETNPKKKQKAKQINTWWSEVEQASLKYALDFSYIYITDITDCYGSLYTHSVSWALHNKDNAKNNKKDKHFLGNIIDSILQAMSYGQTNGIPQGSILMDFIAEIVLGYTDLLLSDKLENKIDKYHIIRYRDDYRIFVNSPTDGNYIIKCLTEILTDLGLKLNSAKTFYSQKIILDSIKKDKIDLFSSTLDFFSLINDKNNQRLLLQIYDFADKHVNSGQLNKILTCYYKNLEINCKIDNIGVLISIITNLAYHNPSIYPICAAILSKLLNCIKNTSEKQVYLKKIIAKFNTLPNTNFMDIWLQRISYKILETLEYSDKLCKIVTKKESTIWNSNWLNGNLRKSIDEFDIVDRNILKTISSLITQNEIDAFKNSYDDFKYDVI